MNMKINDPVSIAKGRKNPENTELVGMVQELGEVTVMVAGHALTFVAKDKAPHQAFPKTKEGYAMLKSLYADCKGQVLTVELG
jgi:hypothetical protein